MSSVYEREVAVSLDEIEEKLVQAVERRNYGVLGSIDLREKMNSKGIEFRPFCRVYEVCNPLRAKKVLEVEMSVSTALPCRISVYQEDGQTKVGTLLPTGLMDVFGDEPKMMAVAHEVENDILTIIEDAI